MLLSGFWILVGLALILFGISFSDPQAGREINWQVLTFVGLGLVVLIFGTRRRK
jgi:LPXTG-motif cell wall-anchored protein